MKFFLHPALRYTIILIIAFGLTGCSNSIHKQVKSALPAYENDTVFIQPDAAIFIFKPEPRSEWYWHQDETPFNAGEYSFKVEFKLANTQYSCGYSLFKHPMAKADSGSFKELIDAGQIDLWKMETTTGIPLDKGKVAIGVTGRQVQYARMRTVVNDNSLAIILKEKDIVEQFNKLRPDSILFLQNYPTKSSMRKAVKVTYRNNITGNEE